jgi:5,10-methylenetetrahydromethanopterin reductase
MGNGLGLMMHTGDMSYEDIVRWAKEAEALDYDTFYVTEEAGKEAFSLLALLAQQTSNIGLGTAIVNFYSRTPTLLAMAARSIHEISGGRFGPFGIGTGGVGFMERGHGIQIERPLARARESVEIIRSLLSEARTTYEGSTFHVDRFRLREGPIPNATIPLWTAGLGPKMIGLGARVADGVITNWLIPESLAEFREIIHKEATAAGRDPAEVTISTLVMMGVDPADEESDFATRRGLAFYCASSHYLHIADLAGLGQRAREVQKLWQARDFDGATRHVSDAMVDAFTVTGSDEHCAQRLRWMFDEGVVPIIYPLPRHSNMVADHFTVLRNAARWAPIVSDSVALHSAAHGGYLGSADHLD